jgi:hypothetical protein
LAARLIIAGLLLLSFGACTPPTGPVGVPAIAMLGGAIQAQGPQGYCVDTGTSRPNDGFAFLVPCAMMSAAAPQVADKAIVTVQAGGPGSAAVAGSEPALAALLQSAQGAALLSADGNAAAITFHRARQRDNQVSVYFTDSKAPPVAGTQPTEWRAFLDIRGRLVTVSLRGLTTDPLSESTGLDLLNRVAATLVAANPG